MDDVDRGARSRVPAPRVAVVGAGTWGTTVAALVATNAPTVLWCRRAALAATIAAERRNAVYLPDLALPDGLEVTSDLAQAVGGADVVAMAVPSHGFRSVVAAARAHLRPDATIVSLAKGIEQTTLARMTEVAAVELAGVVDPSRIGVLTGPNLALEVAEGQPAASVVAVVDAWAAELVQHLFMTPTFRVYTNPDVVGCEVAGASKNVIAIAAGMASGLGYGDNALAALVTRGLAELARLGTAMGGDPMTFAGLAGMGDLVATCVSAQSRNRHVGFQLARGRTLTEVVGATPMVAEGVRTTRAVRELADRHGVEMPIAEQVGLVLDEGRHPADGVRALMGRDAKPERVDLGG